jgi:peptidoglycan/xylan/chitin deacetylase (PgdA/CDA1 family)
MTFFACYGMKWLLLSIVWGFSLALGLILIGDALQQPSAVISITFDDGYVSQYIAADKMEEYNWRATYYISHNLLGNVFEGEQVMSESAVLDLYARGHEIGGHTLNHVEASSVSADEYEREVKDCQQSLCIEMRNFAFPYGDDSKKEIALKYFDTVRSTKPCINNFTDVELCGLTLVHQNNEYLVLEQYLAELKEQRGWLVIVIHGISDNITREDVDLTEEEFLWVLQTIKESGILVMNIQEVRDGKA